VCAPPAQACGRARRALWLSHGVFHAQAGLSQADVARVAARTAAKVKALLARRGLCEDDAEPSAEEPDLSATLQAASLTLRVALGPKAGWKIARVGAGGASPAAVRVPPSASELLADKDGYNVHAGTYVPAHARDKLERLGDDEAGGAAAFITSGARLLM
jgi:hypothetical protein